jgi:hypothetical protein
MKKKTLTALAFVGILMLVLSLDISAQQNASAEKKDGVALARSLDQLGQGLKDSVAVELRQWNGPRKTYVRLKQREGCNITFQVSQVPSNSNVNLQNQLPPNLSYAEWRVNLSDLDIAAVKIEKPAKGDYRFIRFATIGGRESIKWRGGVGDAGWVSWGRIDIEEKYAPQVAAALEQAIAACRE